MALAAGTRFDPLDRIHVERNRSKRNLRAAVSTIGREMAGFRGRR